jgi:hypothetical protein
MTQLLFRFAFCPLVLAAVLIAAKAAPAFTPTEVVLSQTRASGTPSPTTQIVLGPPGSPALAGEKGTATASCPAGWLLVTGGFHIPDVNNGVGTITDVNESSASSSTSNGVTTWSWTVIYRNTGSGSVSAQAQIVCQAPVFENELHVQTIVGLQVTSGPGPSSTSAAATCPAGTFLTGGGYLFQTGGETAHVDGNASIDGKVWQVTVFTPNVAASFKAYAYCISLR